jgi:hypothetical protein
LYCLSFLLAIVLFVLSFGHCIVCPFFCALHNTETLVTLGTRHRTKTCWLRMRIISLSGVTCLC